VIPLLGKSLEAEGTSHRNGGEDGIIEYIFSVIGAANKQCVEFGAWDGKHFSNTWNLIENHGWRGVLIEGDRERYSRLPTSYSDPRKNVYINKFVTWYGEHKLDEILGGTFLSTDFDLLSIDVDGVDWHILASLNDYRPRVIIVEYNPSIPNNVGFVQAASEAVSQGSSLLSFKNLGLEKGYELVFATDTNAFLVRSDLYGRLGLAANTLDAIRPGDAYQTMIFQLYDGTIVTCGRQDLIWQRGKIQDRYQDAVTVNTLIEK